MSSVREATFELLRKQGMRTIFGNPGSTELPMLKDYPDDFSYVLGLQELVVVGMADGFVTAGQQVRAHITMEANLTNREAVVGPQPHVKWSHEPARAQDVPQAIARAIHHASLPPRGPAFVSIPMDDWDAPADENFKEHALRRALEGRSMAHPEALEGHDLVLVVGSSVFPYYPYIPGPLLPAGAALVQITSDAGEAACAPMGTAIIADVALALRQLLEIIGPSERDPPQPRPLPGEPPESDPMSGTAAMDALAGVWPADGIAVVETPSSVIALRNRLRLSKPGSYYFSASGGLGFGIAAAVGV